MQIWKEFPIAKIWKKKQGFPWAHWKDHHISWHSWERTGAAEIQSTAINLTDQKLNCSEHSSEVRLFLSPRGTGSKSVIPPVDNPVISPPSSPSQIPQLPPHPLVLSSMESFRELAENNQSA